MTDRWPLEIRLNPFEAQLDIAPRPGHPVNLGGGFVLVNGHVRNRRRVSVAEFENDMRRARGERVKEAKDGD